MIEEPVWINDVRGLRGDMQKMTQSVDGLTERQRLTDKAIEKKADSATVAKLAELYEGKKWNRRIGVAAIVLALVVLALVVRLNSDRINQQNADRASRSYGSCVQFNVTQQNEREAIVGGIVETFRPLAADVARLEAFAADLRANVEQRLPYRDCSPAGIEAFLRDPPPDPNGG